MTEDPLDKAYDHALVGDGVALLQALKTLDTNALSEHDRACVACMRSALESPPERVSSLPELSATLLQIYQRYWQHSMLAPSKQHMARAELRTALAAALKSTGDSAETLDQLSELAKRSIEREGLYALSGVTGPFYELMIWRKQSRENFVTELHDQKQSVNVVFLEDFASKGWLGFVTCDRYCTAGWAGKDELYALKEKYKLGSESFKVSYLAHEGRHFADYRQYPNLESPELEYRAKLTELSQAHETLYDLLTRFSRQSKLDRSNSHALANYWVTRHLANELGNATSDLSSSATWSAHDVASINAAALKLLKTNDAELTKQSTMKRFLSVAS